MGSSGNGSSTNDDTTGPKASDQLVPTSRKNVTKTLSTALGSKTVETSTPKGNVLRGSMNWQAMFLQNIEVHQVLSCTSSSEGITGTIPRKAQGEVEVRHFTCLLHFRMTNVMPYSCSKISPENGSGFESCNVSSISSSADINLSSNREDSWFVAHPKGSMDSGESLSTK
ncbi:hypothetical protein B296_00046910 [Ensete ventricosum]|uniref:Uncharacterized protein n=1 Tax=Ensete ventricosum TaxID=4639 RepID=A0A426Y3F4_ENSVE|nr:hypothetical protein B296_00046910 [Ensete ventricosum]